MKYPQGFHETGARQIFHDTGAREIFQKIELVHFGSIPVYDIHSKHLRRNFSSYPVIVVNVFETFWLLTKENLSLKSAARMWRQVRRDAL